MDIITESSGIQDKLLISIFVILVLWLLRKLILRIAWRRIEDVRLRYQWRKTSSYIASALGILLVGRVWLEGIQSVATFLGLLAAGLAIALKDPVANLVGWAFIIWRRPLEVGDRIQIGEQAGDVVDLRIFQFTLLEIGNWVDAEQSTGRVIHIPNGKVFTEVLANYSKGFQYIWNEIPVLITFESNWEKAKDLFAKEKVLRIIRTSVLLCSQRRMTVTSSPSSTTSRFTGRMMYPSALAMLVMSPDFLNTG